MLNNIVDNLEQCGQQNIVQCCFHQARTGCAFFAVCVCVCLRVRACVRALVVVAVCQPNQRVGTICFYSVAKYILCLSAVLSTKHFSSTDLPSQ